MGRRKQKKYEKELRDRRAAEKKVNKQEERKAAEKERQAAEKERRANLTPEQRKSENTTDAKMAMGCLTVVLVLVVIIVVACQPGSGDDEDEDTGSSSFSDYSYDSSDDDYSYSDETVSSADAEHWLKNQLGISEFSEILASDPTLWGGYINGIEVDGSMMHVRLQVDHDEDQEMADRAARAIANLARMTSDSTVDGLSWVIIEDGAGRHMAQESI